MLVNTVRVHLDAGTLLRVFESGLERFVTERVGLSSGIFTPERADARTSLG